ncbi:uncharacterized protein LOC113562953 [Ooceraea biroi]|uniref:uncharacterized protein LOC113562953 n=1 Tax=Ooceraea biroi TaxID=2015173 RepID=UPI000F077835|nr:uncharacterized protein LOC113562953 [Ooceraea biroi]
MVNQRGQTGATLPERGRTFLSDEFREGRPSASVVATNVDAVREMCYVTPGQCHERASLAVDGTRSLLRVAESRNSTRGYPRSRKKRNIEDAEDDNDGDGDDAVNSDNSDDGDGNDDDDAVNGDDGGKSPRPGERTQSLRGTACQETEVAQCSDAKQGPTSTYISAAVYSLHSLYTLYAGAIAITITITIYAPRTPYGTCTPCIGVRGRAGTTANTTHPRCPRPNVTAVNGRYLR